MLSFIFLNQSCLKAEDFSGGFLDFILDFRFRGSDIDCDHAFVRCWRFQSRDLGVQQGQWHKMP